MLPPYGHDVNPRSCCSPLRMLSACLDAASLLVLKSFERCRSGGALGQGSGPWDDVTGVFKRAIVDDFSENFVFVDMNARMEAVMKHHEPIMKYQRARRTARQLMRRQQQAIHDA